jgi:hypothetical protein
MSKSKALTASPQCALPGPRVVGGARVSLRGCYQGWQVAEPHGLQAGWRQHCRHRRWKVPKILLLRPGWEWSHRQGQQQHQGSVSFSSVCSLTLQVSQQHLGRIAASSVRSWAFCWSQQTLHAAFMAQPIFWHSMLVALWAWRPVTAAGSSPGSRWGRTLASYLNSRISVKQFPNSAGTPQGPP